MSKKITITKKEIDRACAGYTIVTRPQSGGGVMVAAVAVETRDILWSEIVRDGEVHRKIHQQLRMLDKCGGGWPMASKSRHRGWEKIQDQLDSRR